jgi:predicted DNA-binding transcriptional regulator YafY
VKGHNYEDLADRKDAFRELERAIVARHHVAFEYRKEEGPKAYEGVAPYKLVNLKGIWYLAARDAEKLKTFSFAKIERLRLLESRFEADPAVERQLVEEDGVWLGEERREIVLKVAKEVAGYFKRRKLIANQVIEKELEDGGLIVSAKVGHPNQVLPIVRYWIPHLRIIAPEGLQAELERELARYVESNRGRVGLKEREGSR